MKKMEIISSVYGTIIYGKVIGLKPGTGNAASRLTIVTLNEINENGQIVGGHYIKVLFWNSKMESRNCLTAPENLNQVISYHAVSYLTLEYILKPLALNSSVPAYIHLL